MYRGRAGRVLGRVGSVRLYYSRDVAETLVDNRSKLIFITNTDSVRAMYRKVPKTCDPSPPTGTSQRAAKRVYIEWFAKFAFDPTRPP